MNFASAMFSMMCGNKVRRKHWSEYWCMNNDGEIIIHEKSGRTLNIRDSENITFTLLNIACDDWEVVSERRYIDEIGMFDKHIDLSDLISTALYRGKIPTNQGDIT